MISHYEITDKYGRHICFLVATSEREAVRLARAQGHERATGATWLREA